MRFILNLAVGMMILMAALSFSAPDVKGANAGSIIINEIMYDPFPSELENEWVELYNSGSQPVNVFNWTLSDQDGDVDYVFPDIDFPASGYALVHTGQGQNSSTFVSGRAEFYMWKSSSMWSPKADDCLLSNATGSTVDYVSYGQWNGSTLDPPPGDFDYIHSNASAMEGFTIALTAGQFRESVPTPLENNGLDTAPEILITEVYYNSWGDNEYMKLYNPGLMPVNISHWRLSSGRENATFPSGTEIDPGQTITVSQNSTNYMAAVLELPDMEYTDRDAAVPEMDIINTEPVLANDGDELFLLNIYGTQIDAFVYGDSDYDGTGWSGLPAPVVKQGQIARRSYNGTYAESNNSADWASPRPYVIGQSDFQTATFAGIDQMRLFSSPDSSFGVVSETLANASQYIRLNLYEFTNTRLCDKLLAAIARGVSVHVFMEGSPVGGMNETQLYIMRQIVEAGGSVRVLTNDPDNDIHARYDYDHGKYAVIDDDTLIIMSENWGWTGVPPTGRIGNRGWGAVVSGSGPAGYFGDVFESDWNPQRPDSVIFDQSHEKWDAGHNWTMEYSECEKHFDSAHITSNSIITPVISPDTSLSNYTILGMLNSARERVYVEEFYIYKHWGDRTTGSTTETPNIYLEAVINAARRGCEVKVLMDASYYNIEPDDPIDNDDTADYINEIALAENLDLEAKVVNITEHDFIKIHNKGLIADDEVLISSINWNRNSATENRETGIIIENQQAADFFTGIFNYDWKDDTTPPYAHFSYEPSYIINTTVEFSSNGSFDNVGIVNYTWLMDGQPIFWGINLTHNFTATGFHTLNLTLEDAWGNTGWVEHVLNITVRENAGTVVNNTDSGNLNDTSETGADDSMDRAIAVLLLVPVFIFIAIVYLIRIRGR